MSFGDPNNPYGQQPQGQPQGQPYGQQPGYGYPQQAPQGVPPQGGYAYPQQTPQGYPGYPAGPGGFPGMPMQMPGNLKAARVIMFIVGGLQLILGLLAAIGGAVLTDSTSSSSSSASDLAGGLVLGLGIFIAAVGVLAIVLAAKFANGGNGVRITTIVYGALSVVGALSNFAQLGNSGSAGGGIAGGIIGLALGITILSAAASSSGAAWFKRPRY